MDNTTSRDWTYVHTDGRVVCNTHLLSNVRNRAGWKAHPCSSMVLGLQCDFCPLPLDLEDFATDTITVDGVEHDNVPVFVGWDGVTRARIGFDKLQHGCTMCDDPQAHWFEIGYNDAYCDRCAVILKNSEEAV
jgi:hypothetical protein